MCWSNTFFLSPFRVIKEKLGHKETVDKKETWSDSGYNTHPVFFKEKSAEIFDFIVFVSQGNKGARGLVGIPGYIVSTDDFTIYWWPFWWSSHYHHKVRFQIYENVSCLAKNYYFGLILMFFEAVYNATSDWSCVNREYPEPGVLLDFQDHQEL